MENSFDQQLKMDRARRKVKSIKGFYRHLFIYLIINALILLQHYYDLKPGEEFLTFNTFSTAIFWGLGVIIHAFSVFGTDVLFGSDWEERKIKKLMNRDSGESRRWE